MKVVIEHQDEGTVSVSDVSKVAADMAEGFLSGAFTGSEGGEILWELDMD